jgi:hypothetical protein
MTCSTNSSLVEHEPVFRAMLSTALKEMEGGE